MRIEPSPRPSVSYGPLYVLFGGLAITVQLLLSFLFSLAFGLFLATNFVAIDMPQEPPPALPIRASLQVDDTQENQDQFYYSGPPLGLPPVPGAAVYLHVP